MRLPKMKGALENTIGGNAIGGNCDGNNIIRPDEESIYGFDDTDDATTGLLGNDGEVYSMEDR